MAQLGNRLRALLGRTRTPDSDKQVISTHSERRVVVGSILVLLLIGLPLWWTTTRVYRAALPVAEISRYASTDVLRIPVFFHIDADSALPPVAAADIEKTVRTMVKATRGPRGSGAWPVRYSTVVARGKAPAGTPGHYSVRVARSDNASAGHSAVDVSPDRTVRITLPRAAQLSAQSVEQSVARVIAAIVSREERAVQGGSRALGERKQRQGLRSRESRGALKFAPHVSVTLTLLNENPVAGAQVDWEIEKAAAELLQPLVDALQPLTRLSVTSQVLHHAGPPPVTPIVRNNATYLTPPMLSHFVNSPSWNLASVDPVAPTLNFILYVPALASQPVRILESEAAGADSVGTNAFSIPQWGGVAIANLPAHARPGSKVVLSSTELQPHMGVFVAQLRALLGIRSDTPLAASAASAADDGSALLERGTGVRVQLASETGVSGWELDALMRQWTIQGRQTAITTLQSLVRLVDSLQNMVVMDAIKTQVDQSLAALSAIDSTPRAAVADYSAATSFASAATAAVLAETAFFDPSMVSMLYFPDQHKYAIYFPFFLPVAIPVLSAIRHLVIASRRRRRKAVPDSAGKKDS
ncbi:GPI transamidase component [Coemansia sp. RSA 2049]|nr:GPI transamidase component [Coemansia sp. RSA 2049]KAJ2516411.1 GPI transamidase component [Coemansia sp. RSA 1939]KAJ2608054.1 GPI transamidase component [Coemansia sp. RSA 1804]KAJ2682748.1 GPI transamidase component [Coemansia sp. RSA 1285]